MRASKAVLLDLVFALLCILGVAGGIAFEDAEVRRYGSTLAKSYAVDAQMRRNEILCAHKGVNSFHIWDRTTTLDGFYPLGRPDMPSVEPRGRLVHAYPAWQTVYFYFLGYIPDEVALLFMTAVLLAGLGLIAYMTYAMIPAEKHERLAWSLAVLSVFSYAATQCFYWHNYGLLVVALAIVMFGFLGRGHEILAGCCWAVMMVKPQLGAMFVWPLLFQKKYRTIVTAVAVCLLATCIAGCIYKESPLALLLQIPEAGAPYSLHSFYEGLFIGRYGKVVQLPWFAAVFCLCGGLCWVLRQKTSWVVRCLPVAFLMPLWTHNQPHDLVIRWILYMAIVMVLLGKSSKRKDWLYGVLTLCVCIFTIFWNALTSVGVMRVSGFGWIYRLVDFTWTLLTFVWIISIGRDGEVKREALDMT